MNSFRAAKAEVAGFVLAGGRSSRMGRDKALLELGGKTLAARSVELLQSAGLSAQFAGSRSELGEIATVIPDDTPDQGPLSGICSALGSSEAELAVFIPVDLPFLPASSLQFLVSHAQTTGKAVTLFSANGFPQTFPVALHRKALPILRGELDAGRLGCFAAFRAAATALNESVSIIPVEYAVQSGHVTHPHAFPPHKWFINLNVPADLERSRSAIA